MNQEEWFFWSSPSKVEVLTNNFSHTNSRVTKLWSHDHIYSIIWLTWQNFVADVIVRKFKMITFISKHLYFEKAWSSQFCWHHQNSNYIYLKKSPKTQKKLKNQNLFTKTQSISEFSGIAKLADFWSKSVDISRTERVYHVIHIFFGLL